MGTRALCRLKLLLSDKATPPQQHHHDHKQHQTTSNSCCVSSLSLSRSHIPRKASASLSNHNAASRRPPRFSVFCHTQSKQVSDIEFDAVSGKDRLLKVIYRFLSFIFLIGVHLFNFTLPLFPVLFAWMKMSPYHFLGKCILRFWSEKLLYEML